MKIKIKIDGQFYDVEIGNLSERPILTLVDGETFEVWPESKMPYTITQPLQQLHKGNTPGTVRSAATPSPIESREPRAPEEPTSGQPLPQSGSLKYVRAPIPGVITALLVHPGSEVNVGQELCKLEAMKMNNSIRASKAGKVTTIHVSIGQHVKHNDVLIEFSE